MAYGIGGYVKKRKEKDSAGQNREQKERTGLNHEDLALKTAAQFLGDELRPLLGIPGRVKYIAPTENVKLQARQMYQDFNYISGSGSWIHLEFESDSVTKEDLRRFREYEAATSRSFNVAVVTYVICTSGVKQLLSKLTEGINSYQVKVIRLKNRDADRVIEQLEEKQKRGKALDKSDLVPLLLTPLMSGKLEIVDRIIKSLHILREASSSVTEMELEKMQAVLYALADKFLQEQELDRVKEMIAMTKLGEMLLKDGMERGLADGKAEGKVEGKAEGESKIVAIIRKKRQKNLNVQMIAENLELDASYVGKVVALMEEDPTRTDLQVAEILVRQE